MYWPFLYSDSRCKVHCGRRLYCSEERPRCKACARHDASCVYPSLSAAKRRSLRGTGSNVSSTPAHEAARPTPRPSFPIDDMLPIGTLPLAFTINDMALLHHWVLTASLAMVNNHHMDKYWQVTFPQISFKHPFVMSGLLALSALHLAYLQPEQRPRLTAEAARYHNDSLQGLYIGSVTIPVSEEARPTVVAKTAEAPPEIGPYRVVSISIGLALKLCQVLANRLAIKRQSSRSTGLEPVPGGRWMTEQAITTFRGSSTHSAPLLFCSQNINPYWHQPTSSKLTSRSHVF